MTQKLVHIWAYVTVAMLALLGLMFVFNPMGAVPEGSTVAEMARLLGLKNLVYSGLLLYALVKKSRSLLVVLLVGRGIMDMLDGGVSMLLGNMAPPYMAAFVTGAITLVAGYLLAKSPQVEK